MTISNNTKEVRTPLNLNAVDRLQLVDFLSTKVGILKMKIQNGEITNKEALDLPAIFEEYQEEGTSLVELKAFEDDLKIALSI